MLKPPEKKIFEELFERIINHIHFLQHMCSRQEGRKKEWREWQGQKTVGHVLS